MIDKYGLDYAQLGIPEAERVAPDLLPILTWPDPTLSEKCRDVTDFDHGWLAIFIARMTYTMLKHDGLGLAAPQVGILKNIIIINKECNGKYFPMVLINPKIEEISLKEQFSLREGCLSVPGYFEQRTRPPEVVISYQDCNGGKGLIELRGQDAFIAQHEIDHLDGQVFVDHLSKFKKSRIMKKVAKCGR